MTEHDFERTARAWLNDGPSTMSDRPLEAALAEIHVTQQRRTIRWARRFPAMFNATRLAALAAGLVVAVVLGFTLLPGTHVGSPPATPTPSPTPMLLDGDWEMYSPLEPGTYVTDPVFEVQVTFTVPAGWTGHVGGPYYVQLSRASDRSVGVGFSIFDDVYADPCRSSDGVLDPPPGPSVDELVHALQAVPGIVATDPVDVTVDGFAGKQLTLTAPESFDCFLTTEGAIWRLPFGAVMTMRPNERNTVRVLDVAGERLVIDVPERPRDTEGQRADVQRVVDSIRLDPGN